MIYPPFLLTTAPGDVNPVTFSFDGLYARSLFESIADFAFWLEVNGMCFIEEEVFQPANYSAMEANPERGHCQNLD